MAIVTLPLQPSVKTVALPQQPAEPMDIARFQTFWCTQASMVLRVWTPTHPYLGFVAGLELELLVPCLIFYTAKQ